MLGAAGDLILVFIADGQPLQHPVLQCLGGLQKHWDLSEDPLPPHLSPLLSSSLCSDASVWTEN